MRTLWTRAAAPAVVVAMCMTGCGPSDDGSAADADRSTETTTLEGTATEAGGCTDEVTNGAGGHDHVDPGTEMEYEGVPPVSGNHWSTWQDISKMVYTADERPDLGELVHSQEHGWTIVWYDESIAGDQAAMADLEAVAAEVEEADAVKVVFMPWTADDDFPDGAHVAITHWGYPEDPGVEHRQFCDAPAAEAILAFAERNPYTDSREPDAP